jgi:hypothetical protein
MTHEFTTFSEMRAAGRTAAEAYHAAKADRKGELFALRMLRTVYGLSLPDAKRVAGALEKMTQPQIPLVHEKVYWEGWDTVEGRWIVEATVVDVRDGFVLVAMHRKFLIPGFQEVPPNDLLDRIPVSYFSKSLVERLRDSEAFLEELAQV